MSTENSELDLWARVRIREEEARSNPRWDPVDRLPGESLAEWIVRLANLGRGDYEMARYTQASLHSIAEEVDVLERQKEQLTSENEEYKRGYRKALDDAAEMRDAPIQP